MVEAWDRMTAEYRDTLAAQQHLIGVSEQVLNP